MTVSSATATHQPEIIKIKVTSGTSGIRRVLGLTGLVGAAIAYFKTAAFVGWAGAGKSLLVGAGTAMGGVLLAIPGALAGAAVGGVLAYSSGSKKAARTGAIAGAIFGGIGGYGYGAYRGYDFAKSALLEAAPVTATFNREASPVVPKDSSEPGLIYLQRPPVFAPGA